MHICITYSHLRHYQLCYSPGRWSRSDCRLPLPRLKSQTQSVAFDDKGVLSSLWRDVFFRGRSPCGKTSWCISNASPCKCTRPLCVTLTSEERLWVSYFSLLGSYLRYSVDVQNCTPVLCRHQLTISREPWEGPRPINCNHASFCMLCIAILPSAPVHRVAYTVLSHDTVLLQDIHRFLKEKVMPSAEELKIVYTNISTCQWHKSSFIGIRNNWWHVRSTHVYPAQI